MTWVEVLYSATLGFVVGYIVGIVVMAASCDYRVRMELSVGPVAMCIWRVAP